MLDILLIYLMCMILIGVPLTILLISTIHYSLTEKMIWAIFIFYPIVAIVVLISGVIKATKGLLDVIKLIIKGGTF